MITHWKDSFEKYNGVDNFRQQITSGRFPKRRSLGPQNGSGILGPQKLLKIVNYATIKENEKMKESMVGVQVELASGHHDPLGSFLPLRKQWSPLH